MYFDFTNFFIISDILKSNFSKANATSLTKGSYLFQLKGAYLNPCKKILFVGWYKCQYCQTCTKTAKPEVLAFILVYLPKLTEVIGTQLVHLSIFAKTG